MKIPAKESQVIYKEKKSKFLGFLIPIESQSDFRNELNELGKKYHDASHICYGWRFLEDKISEGSSDAGEPPGTAGIPILMELQKQEIVNAALFVVRYFGGTKLGTGGLARAYSKCASICIESGELKEYVLKSTLHLNVPAELEGKVRNLIYRFGGKIENSTNSDQMIILISDATKPELITTFESSFSGKVKIEE